KIRDRQLAAPTQSENIQDLVRNELATKKHTATEGLLWLVRALDFTAQALRRNLTTDSEELADSFRGAYTNTLKPHHSFVVKPIFSAAMSATPYRKDFYKQLGDDDAKVKSTLETWLAALENIVTILKAFLDTKEAKWMHFYVSFIALSVLPAAITAKVIAPGMIKRAYGPGHDSTSYGGGWSSSSSVISVYSAPPVYTPEISSSTTLTPEVPSSTEPSPVTYPISEVSTSTTLTIATPSTTPIEVPTYPVSTTPTPAPTTPIYTPTPSPNSTSTPETTPIPTTPETTPSPITPIPYTTYPVVTLTTIPTILPSGFPTSNTYSNTTITSSTPVSPVTPTKPTTATTAGGTVPLSNDAFAMSSRWGMALVLTMAWVML
ncbi:hypothetical protein BLS_008964, partial [Venturia inaequalis]